MKWRIPVLCLFVPLWCLAAEPYVPRVADPVLEPWRWQEMEGLAGQGVLCMDEAKDGTLWFGCIGGLVRYDGLQVERTAFDQELLSRIAHNSNRAPWAISVLCLSDGSLLAVVESGLVRRTTNGEWEVVLADVGAPSYQTRLEQAEDGTIWLLVEDALWRISEDLSEQHVILRAANGQHLTSFCRDGKGDVWVMRNSFQTGNDLIHIPLQDILPGKKQEWTAYRIGVKRFGRESRICAGSEGKIWYVDNVANNGIWFFDPATTTWEAIDDPESHKAYFSLIRDRNGTLWAGGPGSLYAIRGSAEHYYSPSQLGLPSLPLTIHETAAGKWWVIGRGGYVYAMDPGVGQWLTYEGLHFECDAADGRQWFLDGNRGVVSHDPATGEWLRYKHSDGLINWPRSLYASSNGLVWAVGSHEQRAAIGVFDGEKWTRFTHPEFALFIEKGVLEAADGTMWFGAMGNRLGYPAKATGGALQYEVTPEGEARYLQHHASDVFPYTVAQMVQTQDGIIWLGAPTTYRYDPVGETIEVVPDLPTVHTHAMVVDGSGNLWIAKGLFGVYLKENGGWRVFFGEDGLAGKLVVDLLPLQDGTLLAASDAGISRFDGVGWMGQIFNADFGMSTRSGSMRQSADGTIWFNFTNKDVRSPQVAINIESGNRYCTVRYVADSLAPDTSIKEHLEQVDSAGNITVSWSGRDPWDNSPPGKLQYSWRLGQGAWSPFSYETGRTFLNLDGGRHTLEVRARDRDFNIDSTPAMTSFSVEFPIWRRPWFIGMVIVMSFTTASLIWILIYFHEKRLKDRAQHLLEIDQMKTGFFTNISHELRTPLTLISRPLERLLEAEEREENREMLTMALRNANRVWSLASQLLDFRKLEQGKLLIHMEQGDIAGCVREVIDNMRSAANAKQIECRLDCPEQCTGWFDAEKLKKMVQNLVNNAIKYTPVGGEVRVVCNMAKEQGGRETLVLEVEDTGSGIEPIHLQHIFERFYRIPAKSIVDGSGIGLNLTKELVELLGGKIQVESPIRPDTNNPGSRFTIRLPIDRAEISEKSGERGV